MHLSLELVFAGMFLLSRAFATVKTTITELIGTVFEPRQKRVLRCGLLNELIIRENGIKYHSN